MRRRIRISWPVQYKPDLLSCDGFPGSESKIFGGGARILDYVVLGAGPGAIVNDGLALGFYCSLLFTSRAIFISSNTQNFVPRIFFYSLASEAKVIFLMPRFPSSRILKLKFVASEPEFAISRVTGVRTLAKQQTGKSHRNRFQHSPQYRLYPVCDLLRAQFKTTYFPQKSFFVVPAKKFLDSQIFSFRISLFRDSRVRSDNKTLAKSDSR